MRAILQRVDALIDKTPISPRFVRFGIVGGSGVFVNLAVVWVTLLVLPVGLGSWRDRSAMAAGILVSIFTNFLLNDAWTWRDSREGGVASWVTRLGKFYLVSAAAALVQWGVGVVLVERVGVWIYAAQVIGIVVAMGINFALNHLWTFRRRGGTQQV